MASDISVLHVKSLASNSAYPASMSFVVELLDRSSLWRTDYFSLHLDISCPITKQQVKLPVKIKRLDGSIDGG